MQALGNDFVLLDDLAGKGLALTPALLARLADRHFGVGCDQILLIAPPQSSAADIHYRIFNADGSEVGQCGNGVRCVARYCRDHHGWSEAGLRIASSGGLVQVWVLDDGQVRVDMGEPKLDPAAVPFQTSSPDTPLHKLTLGDEPIEFGVCSMGNPHAVLQVLDVTTAPVARLGSQLEVHPAFPERTNVGFAEVVHPGELRLRVWERGVGETLACGTGACAAMAVLRTRGKLAETVSVRLPGGALTIHWAGPGQPLFMTGPAEYVFQGQIATEEV